MRKTFKKQLPLVEASPLHPKAQELEKIDEVLNQNPIIFELARQDLDSSDLDSSGRKKTVGAEGMSAEQVVRTAILKQMEELSYDRLAFHLVDSRVYSRFCRIGLGMKAFKKSTLQKNINALKPETWEKINRILLGWAKDAGIEKGRKARIDCTVVASNIHEPSDSSLLWDTVRVLNRLLVKTRQVLTEVDFPYQDHTKRAKRRSLGVLNTKDKKKRKECYKDLLKVTGDVMGYVNGALIALAKHPCKTLEEKVWADRFVADLGHYKALGLRVVSQTERRVIKEEKVPAGEKVVSLFESHGDIIIKDRRDTYYGHKICLTGGASNLILDCVITEGNPADSSLVEKMFDRQKEIYGRYPLKAALDGGFASKGNLDDAKENGIKDICFSKKRGLSEKEMCRSSYVYKKLRNFRAGIESGISWLKRSFGLDRCTWKGLSSFKSYVWSAIVSANLLTIARKQLA